MTEEEIEEQLAELVQRRKGHIMVIDTDTPVLECLRMNWEEFFFCMEERDNDRNTLIIIKQDSGPLVIRSEKSFLIP